MTVPAAHAQFTAQEWAQAIMRAREHLNTGYGGTAIWRERAQAAEMLASVIAYMGRDEDFGAALLKSLAFQLGPGPSRASSPQTPTYQKAVAALTDAVAALEKKNEELDATKTLLSGVRQDLAVEREHVESLRELLQERGIEEPAKPSRDKVQVPGHVGIYRRTNATGGTVYIASWPNPEKPGDTKWKTVGPSLEDAIAYRAEQIEKEGVPA